MIKWSGLRKLTKVLIVATASLALCAGLVTWWARSHQLVRTVYRGISPDTIGQRFAAETVRVRQILWSRPSELRESISTKAPETTTLTPERHLIFARPTKDGDSDIYVRERAYDGWSPARSIGAPINTPAEETDPALSPRGDRIYFASNRAGTLGGLDLWVSKLEDGNWSEPRNLGYKLNSPYDDMSPALHPDSDILVFSTNRPRGFLIDPPDSWSSVPIDRWDPGPFELGFSIAEARRGRLLWSQPVALSELSSSYDDTAPHISPRGDFLYFASKRPGGSGGFDLYRSSITYPVPGHPPANKTLALSAPENLRSPVNTTQDELRPHLFDQGFQLVFEHASKSGDARPLAESRSWEVEMEIEIAELPLAAILANLGRIILLAGSTLALIIALIVVYKTRSSWTVNLLLRCAVVAILAHVGLLYSFYFWKIGSEILAMAKKERKVDLVVEPALAAAIALEVSRQQLDIPEPDSRSRSEQPIAEARKIEGLEPRAPSRQLHTPVDASPVHSRQASLDIRRASESPSRVEVQKADTHLRKIAFDKSPDKLPQVERQTPRTSEKLRPEALEEAHLEFDQEIARSTKVETAEIAASTTQTPGEVSAVTKMAETAVLGPNVTRLLPSKALSSSGRRALASLPQPAQSPLQSESRTEPAPQRIEQESVATGQALAAESAPTRAKLMRSDRPVNRWESSPIGLEPARKSLEAETKFRASLSAPTPRPIPLASTRAKMPESVPLADLSASEAAESVLAGPIPEQPRSTEIAIEPAKFKSTVSTTAVSPLSTASERQARLVESALARPAPESSPGSVADLRTGRRGDRTRVARPALPEPDKGEKTGDIISPLVPRRSTREMDLETPADLASAGGPQRTASSSRPLKPTSSARRRFTTSPLSEDPLAREPIGPEPSSRRLLPTPTVKLAKLSPDFNRDRRTGTKLPEIQSREPVSGEISKLRRPENRGKLVEQMGGSQASEEAVRLALQWFARHQSGDGRWDGDGFDNLCGQCRSLSSLPDVDAAITGMIVLCYLGHNHTPAGKTEFSRNVTRALDWLLRQQDGSGLLAGADKQYTMYSHAIVTLALSEAYLMTQDRRYLAPLQKATGVILDAQNPETGGWRYQPKPPIRGDTSITGWQILALTSVKSAGIVIPDRAFERARHWLDAEVSEDLNGVYGYRNLSEPRTAMTAEGMYAKQLLGGRRGDRDIENAARYIYSKTRDGAELGNLYLLYYGTLALYQYQGWIWERWNHQVMNYLVKKQHATGTLAGSWDPMDEYLQMGGRLLSTAFATLTLEVYYRYLPLYWEK